MSTIPEINNDPTFLSGEDRPKWSMYASHIGPNGSYMRRWIIRTPWFTIRLHKILRSDKDRHMHDHPFDFASLILSGGYVEETPYPALRQFTRGMINVKAAEDQHKLTLADENVPVWTLVLSGPYRRQWGFHTPKGWVYWREYNDDGAWDAT